MTWEPRRICLTPREREETDRDAPSVIVSVWGDGAPHTQLERRGICSYIELWAIRPL